MQKTKVLYVEDEPFLARVVSESLETRDFDVRLITDGNDATEAFRDFNPDICVLDIMLPKKDGYTIALEIRNMNPDIPIIFLTAKTQTADLIKGFESGGNDYLKKPFSMEELIVRIKNLIQLTSASKGKNVDESILKDEYLLGNYHFYPKKLLLTLDNKERKLSHRETRLLEMLITHGEDTVMRQDILNTLWGDDSFYNSRNLDVYISRLRDYLSQDPGIQIITLKGVGYRFVVAS